MVITCNKKELVHALSIVIKAINSKPEFPILSGIYIKAENDLLEIQGTEPNLSIITTIPANVEAEGIIVVSGKYFYDVIRNLPGDTVLIKLNDTDSTITISSKNAKFNLLAMDHNQFPTIETLKGEINFTITNHSFLNCIKKTSFSVDDKNTLYSGCLLDFRDDDLYMVGTNRHRLAMYKEPFVKIGKNLQVIVPAKILNELNSIFQSKIPTDIEITCTPRQISFKYENVYIISRLLDGQFPDYTKVIPNNFSTDVIINKQEFKEALERIAIIFSNNEYSTINFEFSDTILKMYSDDPNIGRAEETLKVEIEGQDLEIAFKTKNIIEVLKVADTKEIMLSMKESLSTAAIFEVVKEEEDYIKNNNFTYVVTPIRKKV